MSFFGNARKVGQKAGEEISKVDTSQMTHADAQRAEAARAAELARQQQAKR